MEHYNDIVNTLSLALGTAWASGINLYAAVLTLGVLGITDNIVLPENLLVLQNPVVIGAAGIMYVVEFFADKVPGVDTGWDTIHTFIRIPAGVLLAAGAVGDVNPAVAVAAGILGGGMAAGSHATKAGSRVLINASPEPFTNWTASVAEDVAVIGGLWTALHYPTLFIALMILFVLLLVWLLPKIWRGIKKIFALIGRLFGYGKDAAVEEGRVAENPSRPVDSGALSGDMEKKLEELNRLLEKNLISQEEYQAKRAALLEKL